MKLAAVLLIVIFVSSCVPVVEEDPNSPKPTPTPTPKPITASDKVLYDQVSCALKSIYSESQLSLKRSRTLNFIVSELNQGFKTYGVRSNVEKAHFLAQLIHESDGLSATVERVMGPTWRRLFNAPGEKWQCDDYLAAVDEDDSYFDNRYVYSKNKYKSKFRGRGLIQLTGCANYMGYFYHASAQDQGTKAQASTHNTYFPFRDKDGDRVVASWYCSESDLLAIDRTFRDLGLEINPSQLIDDFEASADELALPCRDRGIGNFSSERFVVDSSFWYWKKCQNTSYFSPYIYVNSDQAVSRMTECVHGKSAVYQNYASINCNASNSDDWRKQSYCSRRKAFKKLISCFIDP